MIYVGDFEYINGGELEDSKWEGCKGMYTSMEACPRCMDELLIDLDDKHYKCLTCGYRRKCTDSEYKKEIGRIDRNKKVLESLNSKKGSVEEEYPTIKRGEDVMDRRLPGCYGTKR